MRAEKKHLGKKNIEHIFGKVNEGDEIKKNIGHISGKVNEGDEIKKNIGHISGNVNEGDEIKKYTYFLKKLMRATRKKTSEYFLSLEMNSFFSGCFFISRKWLGFFRKAATI